MKRIILTLSLILALASPAWAVPVVYYVDCAANGDAGAGTSQAVDVAWKTVAKVNASSFSPGDSILFKRGCTWREQLTVPSSGSAGNPITFGAYGTGADPILSGSTVATLVHEATDIPDLLRADFEENNVADITGVTTTRGTVAASSSANLAGSYGVRITFDGTGQDANAYHNVTASSTIYVQSLIRFSNGFAITANTDLAVMVLYSGSTTTRVRVALRRTAGGDYKWYAEFTYGSWAGIYTGAVAPALNGTSVYRLELSYVNGGGAGNDTAVLRVYDHSDNSLLATGTTTSPSASAQINRVRVGGVAMASGTPSAGMIIDIDNMAASTTGWIGGYINGLDTSYYYEAARTADPFGAWRNASRLTLAANKAALDSTTEWWYDADNDRAYVWDDSGTPTGVEFASRNNAVYINGQSYVTIDGLHLKRTGYSNLKADHNGDVRTGLTVQNCTLEDSGNIYDPASLFVQGGNATTQRWVTVNVLNNTIFDTGRQPGTLATDGFGVRLRYVEGGIVDGNTLYGVDHGIHIDTCVGAANYVRRNYIHDTSDDAIWILDSTAHAHYNVIANTGDDIFDLNGADDSTIYNNVGYSPSDAWLVIAGSDGVLVKNNIFSLARRGTGETDNGKDVHVTTSTNTVIDYNVYYQDKALVMNWDADNYATWADWKTNSSQDAHSVNADPLFISPSTSDFHLQATSPCRDAAVDVGLTTDYAGKPVPFGSAPDCGAYEWRSSFMPGWIWEPQPTAALLDLKPLRVQLMNGR